LTASNRVQLPPLSGSYFKYAARPELLVTQRLSHDCGDLRRARGFEMGVIVAEELPER
jgi:hypothetical protein